MAKRVAPPTTAKRKVAPFRRHVASDEERVLVWVAVRLVGSSAASRLHTISRESARRITSEVDGDVSLEAARTTAWKSIVDQLATQTAEALSRAFLRLSALLADPHAKLSPATLMEIIQGLSTVQRGDAPKGGANGTPTMAIPAFLLRERRVTPSTPKDSHEPNAPVGP